MLIYRIVIILIRIALWISYPFSASNRRFLKGRKGVFRKLKKFSETRNPRQPVYWFHCASLGEFEQGRPLMEAMKAENPKLQIVLTFFSPSGYEVRKNYVVADLVCYLPLDGKRNAERFLEYVRPKAAFFVKYEFWYGYLSVLKQKNIPSVSVSTLLRNNAAPFRWYGGFYRNMLRKVTYFFPQDQNTVNLLKEIGIEQVKLAGDTRFDRVADICKHTARNELVAAFKDESQAMIIGSSWPADMEVLLPFMKEMVEEIKLIIAPHNIEEEELERIENELPYKTVRYSKAKKGTISNYRVLIIDNVGMLTSLYRYGEYAYVGGAFGKSLHNILEPATFGMPIFFGDKSYRHVNEANALLKRGVAFTVGDNKELRDKFKRFLNNKEERLKVAEECRSYVQENTGATKLITAYIAQKK
ncbi:3-deoxy-D-manno-octulosonic acid transferase [Catalinimonas niigatensis]|uniref:3-deoxy-D-manno-octulosonic acid transferase n=1 Tax=Catalinimonas niigatensis TaxID=1397264 RepID=UPI002666FB68|nr:glycosyltransferase N-terminal domain-containing protein [Catalinimonas niigatensis]WPP48159.1 glycosyltransferase N-terminal domain-containing protein [Catalinimonas niigatensis]